MTEDQIKKNETERIQREEQIAFRQTFSTKAGEITYRRLEKFCNFKNTSVCEQAPNALQTAFNEGKRRVFLKIIGTMDKGKKK